MSDYTEFSGRLIVERQSPELRERLWQLVQEAKGNDAMTPVTVVGPTRYANLSLRHEFGRTGFANVRFIVLPVLSEMLGAASLAAAGRRPLSGALEGVAMRAVLSQATGPLAPVSVHASTQASVRASFRELRKAPDQVVEGLERQGGVRSEVVRLFRQFRQQTSPSWYDAEDLAVAAAEAVEEGRDHTLDELGLIIFYLPRDVGPGESRLIEALAQRGRCAVLLGLTGDGNADGPSLALADRLGGVPPTPPGTVEQHTLEQHLPLPLPPGEAALHIAPSAHEELRWVIREIVRDAAEMKTPFHRMAILYRAEHPYATLIPDELAMAGIPAAGPGREALADTGPGRTLVGLLGLADGTFRRTDVMSWLTGCPVSPPDGRTPGFNPSHWDLLSRKAGVVAGLHQWQDNLVRYARDLDRDAERRLPKEEITQAQSDRMRFEATASRNAHSFIEHLAGDVTPPAAGSTWQDHCRWAKRLMETYLSRNLSDAEGNAAERIEQVIDGLPAADSISPATDLATFRQTVIDALKAPTGQLGPTGAGVFVSNFAAAAGMSFDAIWLVGMIEGAVPPAVRPDPLLPEYGWQDAGGNSRNAQRIALERGDYLSALAAAPRRTLTYPVADGSSQREAYPSRWFLEQASALEGKNIYSGDLPKLRNRPWLTTTDSAEHGLGNASEPGLADRHDYLLHRLLAWKGAGQQPGRHPLLAAGVPARTIRAGRSRNLRRLTEFDGNLSAAVEESEFQPGPDQSPVSATSLESWATCPYRYFLGHVLRLSALDTPEEVTTISPMERGNLLHDILEDFIRDTVEAGELPAPGNAWGPQGRERLAQTAESHFRAAEARGVTGRPLLWDLAKHDIRDDLETFLEEDESLRGAHGTARLLVEADFGTGSNAAAVEDPETGLRFRGRIDRIDLTSDGSSAMVIDYKTGSSASYEGLEQDVIDRGKRLQLGVYSLAARTMFPQSTEIRAGYWFTRTSSRSRFAPSTFFNIDDSDVRERFRQGVTAIVQGIGGGMFPANPGPWTSRQDKSGPQNCLYCDFDSLCPARRVDLWGRKKSDPAAAGYLALAEPAEED